MQLKSPAISHQFQRVRSTQTLVQKTKAEDRMTAETGDVQEVLRRRTTRRAHLSVKTKSSRKMLQLLEDKEVAKEEVVVEEVEEEVSAPKQPDHRMVAKIKALVKQVLLLPLRSIHLLVRDLKVETKIENHSRVMVAKEKAEIVVETAEVVRVVKEEELLVAVELPPLATPNQLRNELRSWHKTISLI